MDADQNSELTQQRSAATGRGGLRHRFKRLLDDMDNNSQLEAKKQRAEDCTEASGCTGKTHSDWLSNTYHTGRLWGRDTCDTDSDNEGDVVVESRMRPPPPELPLHPNKPAAAPPSPPRPYTPWHHAFNAHTALAKAPVSGAAANAMGVKAAFGDHKPWIDTKALGHVALASKHLPSLRSMEVANADKQLQPPPACSPAAGLEADRRSEDVQMQLSADCSPKPTAHAKARPDTPAASALSKGKLWPAKYNPYLRRYLRAAHASGKQSHSTGENLDRLEACMAEAGECEDAFLSPYEPPPLPEDWDAEE